MCEQKTYRPLSQLSRWFLGGILCLLTSSVALADRTVNVPLNHSIYAFVERYEARGILGGEVNGIRPYSRLQVANLLVLIRSAIDAGYAISLTERSLLVQYESEWAFELGREEPEGVLERLLKKRPALLYRAEEGQIQADVLVRQQTNRFTGWGRTADEVIYRNTVGGTVRGNVGQHLGFRMSFAQTREQGSRTYVWRDQVFQRRIEVPQLKGTLTDYHEAMAYMTVSLPYLAVEFGKDEARWGPGREDNLGLSNHAPSFPMLRLKSQLGAFRLVSIAGVLRACPDRPDSPLCSGMADQAASYIVNRQSRTIERSKYIAAHRLEVALTDWLDLGFHEVVIYGDRGLEPVYLNPFMFYWAAQSHLGDKDNVMMGLDIDIHRGDNRRYYLSYVIDDLKKAAIFSDDFANKFSLQAGLFWVDPPLLSDGDLLLEYVRVEPWIYTHKFPINTFRHFDAPLGHALEPNSDLIRLVLEKRLSHRWTVRVESRRSRHGENEILDDGSLRNVGGDIHYGWRPGDERMSKKFLDGLVQKRTEFEARVHWDIAGSLGIELGFAKTWAKDVYLPPNWGSSIPRQRRTGIGSGAQQELFLDIRYRRF